MGPTAFGDNSKKLKRKFPSYSVKSNDFTEDSYLKDNFLGISSEVEIRKFNSLPLHLCGGWFLKNRTVCMSSYHQGCNLEETTLKNCTWMRKLNVCVLILVCAVKGTVVTDGHITNQYRTSPHQRKPLLFSQTILIISSVCLPAV